jgi:hypothetical protein
MSALAGLICVRSQINIINIEILHASEAYFICWEKTVEKLTDISHTRWRARAKNGKKD